MRRAIPALLLFGAVLTMSGSTPAKAISALPSFSVSIDGQVYQGVATPTVLGSKVVYSIRKVVFETAEGVVTLNATANPDPFIAYALGVVDIGAPSVFGFAFGLPIAPQPAGSLSSGSVVGGLADALGDGVAITPLAPPPGVPVDPDGILELQVGSDSVLPLNLGVDVGLPAAFGPGPGGALYSYGPHSAGSVTGGPVSFLRVDANFGLSGGGDRAELNGFLSVTPVPEPASLSLLLAGLVGTGLLGLRRARTA